MSMDDARTAADFFTGHIPPGLPDDAPEPSFDKLCARAESLDSGNYPIDALLTILIRRNRELGADATVIERLENSEKPLFIVAGQQAGLFGGPLYTLYKALHAIRLARRMEDALGRPVLPLFWVASDDHDIDEVAHLGLITDDGSTDRVTYIPKHYHEGMPVGETVLDDGIAPALETLKQSLNPGPAGDAYYTMLADCWKPGLSWTEAFARQYISLLSAHGLILFDPRWEGIKELFGNIIDKELTDPLASTMLVNEQANSLDRAADRKRAIRKHNDATNLFHETDGRRETVTWDGSRYHAGEASFASEAMRALAISEPWRFSPGAVLRPVCQDAVMPVLATIAGPGERRYLAQIEPVYRMFGITPSVVWPRASFTVIDRRTARNAAKESIAVSEMFGGQEHIETKLARQSFPSAVEEVFETLVSDMDRGFGRLGEVIAIIDRSLTGAVEKERGRAAHLLDGLKARVLRAHKAAHELTSKRLAAASYFLMPEGGPQERWFGIDAILPVLDELGVETFIELTSPGEHNHRIVSPRK